MTIVLFNPFQLHRLTTHEDYFNTHKICGVLVLGHFIYRLLLWYQNDFNGIYMDYSQWTPFWIIIHLFLHITSFSFKLSSHRNRTYNIIWPEMRWHSMIFAYRSLLAMLVQWLGNKSYIDKIYVDIMKSLIILGTIILADVVTYYYKNDATTMRGNPYPKWVPSWYIPYHNLYYSISQIMATMNILFYDDMGKLFLLLIPIQTAPLCMTLVKKGIIDQFGWHFYYTIALGINYIYGFINNNESVPHFYILTMIVIIGRLKYNLNKYYLWFSVILCSILHGSYF
jgi:hypothetical protein